MLSLLVGPFPKLYMTEDVALVHVPPYRVELRVLEPTVYNFSPYQSQIV